MEIFSCILTDTNCYTKIISSQCANLVHHQTVCYLWLCMYRTWLLQFIRWYFCKPHLVLHSTLKAANNVLYYSHF